MPDLSYTSPKTGKVYNFGWNNPQPPTNDDLNALKASVDKAEGGGFLDNIKDSVNQLADTHPSTLGKLRDFNNEVSGRVGQAVNSYGKQVFGPLRGLSNPDEANKIEAEGAETLKHPIRSSINTILPIDQVSSDIKKGNYGGAVASGAMAALPFAGLGLEGLKGGEALGEVKNPEVLPAESSSPKQLAAPPKVELPQLPAKGQSSYVEPQAKPRFIASPDGGIGDVTDPSMIEALQSKNLTKPGTSLSSTDTLRPDVTTINLKANPAWDWSKLDNRPEVPNPGDYRDMPYGLENIKRKTGEATQRDWLTDKGNIFSTVPDRLRPEAPNAGLIRSLVGDITPPSDNAPVAKTVTINSDVPNPKVKQVGQKSLPDQILPSAPVKGSISRFNQPAPVEPSPVGRVNNPYPQVRTGQVEVTRPGLNIDPNQVSKSGAVGDNNTPQVTDPNKPVIDTQTGLKFLKANPTLKRIMDDWVTSRGSTVNLQGKKATLGFADSLGKYGDTSSASQFAQDVSKGQHPLIDQFAQQKLIDLSKAGVATERRGNYLGQIFKDSSNQISQVFGNLDTGKSPSFHDIIKDYGEGAAKGLTPAYAPKDLPGFYETYVNKQLANKKAIDSLLSSGYAVKATGKSIPDGFSAVDRKAVPYDIATPKALTPIIENFLTGDDNPITGRMAQTSGTLSQGALGGQGLPGTGVNFHGANIVTRAWTSGGFKQAALAIKDALMPGRAESEFNSNIDSAIQMSKYGVNFDIENPNVNKSLIQNPNSAIGRGVNYVGDKFHQLYVKPTFEQMIPNVKLRASQAIMDSFAKQGVPPEVGGPIMAQQVNNIFSGLNYDLLYRDKTFRNLVRSIEIAPGWLESTARTSGNMAKSVGQTITNPIDTLKGNIPPENQIYLKMAGRVAATYAAANILSKALNGKWMVQQNDPFNLHIGKTSEPLFGTTEFSQLPIQMTLDAMRQGGLDTVGKDIKNRLSPPAEFGLSTMTGQNQQGQPNIFSHTDRFGHPVSFGDRTKNTLSDLTSPVPAVVRDPVRMLMGNEDVPRGLLNMSGLPINLPYPPKGPKSSFNPPKFKF